MDLSIPHALRNYIGGHFDLPQNGSYLQNYNPATGELLCQVPDSDKDDLEKAVRSARRAFPQWSNTSPEERFNLLNLIAFLITEYCEALSLAETLDNGKPAWLCKSIDIPRAAANFRFFATAAMQFASESHSIGHQEINYTLRQPVGIVGCISPWNLPLYLFTMKIAPALAAGNCVIAKPSEITPVTAYLLSCICHEAGLPAGVLNVLHGTGTGCGELIVRHPAIKAISFTGSTSVGKRIASIAGPMFKKTLLEMGGKNANIIFADCNWEKMMESTLLSSFNNQGQTCNCNSRILIEKSIYEKFKTDFVQLVSNITVGDPMKETSKQGAIVSKAQFDKILKFIQLAKKEGGLVLCGGKEVKVDGSAANGCFIQPTVIEGLGPNSQTNREEIFGPIVTLQSFETEREALHLANASDYGMAATIWTQDISRANRLATHLQTGMVWINSWKQQDLRTPFGGIKNSGLGKEGGLEAMHFYTEAKNVCVEF
jgi:aminomuconate-semialdehyde/2-hydroxymuconate-6-semialdehyde dehydrogenase